MNCLHPLVAFWLKPEYAGLELPYFRRPLIVGEYVGIGCDYSRDLNLPLELYDKIQQYLLPCGKCEACRMANMRQWIFRAMCELDEHPVSAFITLTVDDSHKELVFPSGKLQHRYFQLFMKRLRKWHYEQFLRKYKDCKDMPEYKGLRYMMCGEYGTNTLRPHYHVIVFGWFPKDYKFLGCPSGSYYTFTSDILGSFWSEPKKKDSDPTVPYGFHTVSVANEMTIRYLVGYVLKKCDARYPSDAPPYLRCSSRPALGLKFYEKYKDEFFAQSSEFSFPNSYAILSGKKLPLPRYFLKRYQLEADNVDYVHLQEYRRRCLADKQPLEKSDLERLEAYFRQVTKASHNVRVNEV